MKHCMRDGSRHVVNNVLPKRSVFVQNTSDTFHSLCTYCLTSMMNDTSKKIKILICGRKTSADLSDFLACLSEQGKDSADEDLASKDAYTGYNVDEQITHEQMPQIMIQWETQPRSQNVFSSTYKQEKASDLSSWFNYGFNETTFKAWVQWQLVMRKKKSDAWKAKQQTQ